VTEHQRVADLVRALRESQRGFTELARSAPNEGLRWALSEAALRRGRFAGRLEELAQGEASAARDKVDWPHEDGFRARELRLLADLRRNEELLLFRYDRALAEQHTAELGLALEQQYAEIEETGDHLRELGDGRPRARSA
jgi:hypothetical protein